MLLSKKITCFIWRQHKLNQNFTLMSNITNLETQAKNISYIQNTYKHVWTEKRPFPHQELNITLDMGDVLCIYNSDNLYIIDNNLIVIHHFITFDLIAWRLINWTRHNTHIIVLWYRFYILSIFLTILYFK